MLTLQRKQNLFAAKYVEETVVVAVSMDIQTKKGDAIKKSQILSEPRLFVSNNRERS